MQICRTRLHQTRPPSTYELGHLLRMLELSTACSKINDYGSQKGIKEIT